MDLAYGVFWFNRHHYVTAVLFSVLLLVFGYSLYRRRGYALRFARRLYLWYVVIVTVQIAVTAALYWIEWHRWRICGIACLYYFPPYSNYYFNQTIVQWTSILAFNACVGLVGGILFSLFARWSHGRIIDRVDVDLLTVGGMIAGWPNILIFYGLVFVATILVTIVRAVLERSTSVRMVITPVLPLAAAAVALFGDVIAKWLKLYNIGISLF